MISVVASSVVTLLNGAFQLVMTAFAEFEKPLSVSDLDTSKMTKVFVAQFVNTAIIILLINYNAAWISFLMFGTGDYGDFERGWYTNVGGAVVTTMLLNVFTGSATLIGKLLFKKCCRFCLASFIKTQDELLELYTNPPFEISLRFAQLLMTAYCTLLYSSAMPILNLFAAAYCFLTYWTDKIVLLKGSKRPPTYDHKMVLHASTILVFAGFLHIVFAIGVYSHGCTFPSDAVGGQIDSFSDQAFTIAASNLNVTNSEDVQQHSFFERATRESTWVHFLLTLALIVFFCVWLVLSIVGATLGEAWRFMITVCCPKRAQVLPDDSEEVSLNMMGWDTAKTFLAKACPPISYRVESNPEFAPYAKHLYMDWDEDPAEPIPEAPEDTLGDYADGESDDQI